MEDIEYIVDERNEFGEPSVIEQRTATPSSYLRDKYLDAMPKKRRVEQFLLKQRDQERLKHLFNLPKLLEEARCQRVEQGQALEKALKKLSSVPDEPKKTEVGLPVSKQASSPTVSSPRVTTQTPVRYIFTRGSSDTALWMWVFLSVFFFTMAYSRDSREFVTRKIIVDIIVDTIIPPLFDMACIVGKSCMEIAPIPSKIILALYYCWKVWVSVGALIYIYCKIQEVCGACTVSVVTLWQEMNKIIGKVIGKFH